MIEERYRFLEMWDFVGSSLDGEAFEIEGVNIWQHDCQVQAGPEAHVKDPVYRQDSTFRFYAIQDGKEKLKFAQGVRTICRYILS
jgi:hypothetical protein